MSSLPVTYLLPLRRGKFDPNEIEELRSYLQFLSGVCAEVIVIDGSPSRVFDPHHALLRRHVRHEQVDRSFGFKNDKVNGIHTGLALASCEKVIIADDDIRYDPGSLQAISGLLDQHEVVRPQNYIAPLPWWARMECARMLINRATLAAADYPGTCAVHRSTMQRTGPYDGDVLFDNEEMIRHFVREGVQVCYANDLFVRKRPVSLAKWREQRPRQAYEDFGLRAKTALFLLLPIVLALGALLGRRWFFLAVFTVGIVSILLAAYGRNRGQARSFFPLKVCFYAPLWILERTMSTYWALGWHLRAGGYPFGETILSKGIGRDWIAGGQLASRQLRGQS